MRTVGRFEILREVGRGGMAMVWLARQTDLDRLVALKELAPFHAADPSFAARFLRESRIAGSLNHPNIVTVHDYFESESVPFISMEYMEHGSLRPLIGSLSLAQVAYVLEGMLAGLAYAEAQGIVHRDLKPENVLVRGDGQVKIADFGIAKAFNQASSSGFHTVTGTTVGTPAYMAPEQAMAKELGPYTDLYSTGVMAYEMLVGQVPFSDTETPVAILMRHVNDPPPAPRTIRPDLDPEIEAWLLKMLAKNPADRYQHATDAWDALEETVVTKVGPRWRRDARVLGLGGGTYTPTPTPLPSLPKIVTPPPVNAPLPPEPEAPSAPLPPMVDPFRPAAAVPDQQLDSFEWPALDAEPEAETPSVPEPNATVAPRTVQQDSFEWPSLAPEAPTSPTKPPTKPPKSGGRSRKPLAIGAGLIVLVGAGVVAAIALSGGSSPSLSTETTATTSSSTPTTTTTTKTTKPKPIPRLPDVLVPAASRSSIISAGGSLYATGPGGKIARLNGRTLRQLAVTVDSAHPRALAVIGRTLVVADDHTILWLRADTLAPIGASAFGSQPVLGGGGRSPIVAASGHRICLVGTSALGACGRAPFVVTGVGAAANGTILAVDGGHGRLVTFARAGKRLVLRGAAIVVGKPTRGHAPAHGPVLVVGSRAYVPVPLGLAVVDLGSHTLTTTIDTRWAPGAPALVGGTIVAPVPGGGEVALIPANGSAKKPTFVPTGPLAYAATAGTGSTAYVANAKDGTVTLVDAAKGKALRRVRVSALRGSAVAKAVVRKGTVASAGGKVTVTLQLGSGAIDASGVRIRSLAIAHGAAVVELWQGGIASAVGRVTGTGITATVRPAPGRLVVRLSAAAGDFTAMSVARTKAGRAIVFTLTPKPVVTPPTGNTGGGGGTSSGGGGGGGTSTGGAGGGGTSTGGGGGTSTGGGGGGTSTGGGGGGIGNF
jgi:serine/threonine protein kinase